MSNTNGADKRRETVRSFGMAEYKYGRFSCVLKPNQTFEDTLHPEFWAPQARMLCGNKLTGAKDQTGGIIEVRTEDHRFYAELYIREVRENAVFVAVLREPIMLAPETSAKEEEVSNFTTRWNVGVEGYQVIRTSDKEVIGPAKGFKRKEEALKFISEMAA